MKANDKDSLKQIVELFNATDLKTVKSLAKNIVLTRKTLVGLILVSESGDLESMPYCHKMNVYENVPGHLIPTDEEMEAFSNNGPGKFKGKAKTFANKIFQTLEERKIIIGHLFYTPSQEYWHVFYFSAKDIDEEQNHWKMGGKHVHYVSSLWPNLSIADVWERLKSGKKDIGSNVHIRYVE